MVEADPLESAFLAGAATGLRRRAGRQAQLAADGTSTEHGSVIQTGEAAIAVRVAVALAALAAEFESEAST
jgi:hypothetical protein